MNRVRQKPKGYTLLEVLVALVIASVGLLGLAQLQVVATRSNSFSNQITLGITLGQDLLEALRNLDYEDAELADGDHVDSENPIQPHGDLGFNRRWRVTEDAANHLKTITVTVGWPDPSEPHRVQFTTVKSP